MRVSGRSALEIGLESEIDRSAGLDRPIPMLIDNAKTVRFLLQDPIPKIDDLLPWCLFEDEVPTCIEIQISIALVVNDDIGNESLGPCIRDLIVDAAGSFRFAGRNQHQTKCEQAIPRAEASVFCLPHRNSPIG